MRHALHSHKMLAEWPAGTMKRRVRQQPSLRCGCRLPDAARYTQNADICATPVTMPLSRRLSPACRSVCCRDAFMLRCHARCLRRIFLPSFLLIYRLLFIIARPPAFFAHPPDDDAVEAEGSRQDKGTAAQCRGGRCGSGQVVGWHGRQAWWQVRMVWWHGIDPRATERTSHTVNGRSTMAKKCYAPTHAHNANNATILTKRKHVKRCCHKAHGYSTGLSHTLATTNSAIHSASYAPGACEIRPNSDRHQITL